MITLPETETILTMVIVPSGVKIFITGNLKPFVFVKCIELIDKFILFERTNRQSSTDSQSSNRKEYVHVGYQLNLLGIKGKLDYVSHSTILLLSRIVA